MCWISPWKIPALSTRSWLVDMLSSSYKVSIPDEGNEFNQKIWALVNSFKTMPYKYYYIIVIDPKTLMRMEPEFPEYGPIVLTSTSEQIYGHHIWFHADWPALATIIMMSTESNNATTAAASNIRSSLKGQSSSELWVLMRVSLMEEMVVIVLRFCRTTSCKQLTRYVYM